MSCGQLQLNAHYIIQIMIFFEQVNDKSESMIYAHFLELFNKIHVMDNIVISDFKLGDLRWTISDIVKGVNNGVSFNDALKN